MNTNNSHYAKYEALFQLKPHVVDFIPFTKDQVRTALESGDECLNSLPLKKWDIAAEKVGWTNKDADGKLTKSLSQQVCLLKHVARYHYK